MDSDAWAAKLEHRAHRRRSVAVGMVGAPLLLGGSILLSDRLVPTGLILVMWGVAATALGAWRRRTALAAGLGAALSLIVLCAVIAIRSSSGLGFLALVLMLMAVPPLLGVVLFGAFVERRLAARGGGEAKRAAREG